MSDKRNKLTVVKSDVLDDWYLIERAKHDGREWIEQTERGLLFRRSARITDADVEGYGHEMLEMAAAIEAGGAFNARRCAVRPVHGGFALWSPRNSSDEHVATEDEAKELAAEIRRVVQVAGKGGKATCIREVLRLDREAREKGAAT